MASVQVVVRLRPMNSKETKEGTLPVITASTSNKSVTVIKGIGPKQARSQFTFDNVFTSFSTQHNVFSETLCPVISDVLKGFETCVFAYGQTGTGKTHTMEGNLDDADQFGVIPRAAQAIFDTLQKPQYLETNVSCSYLEIYNEELSDLLAPGNSTKLDIVQGGKGGVHCRGLSHHTVQSPHDVLQLMHGAVQARHVGETSMNKQSSRSHCIFTIRVDTKQILADGSTLEAQGKLHMVDLAGSESAKTAALEQSSARDQAAREQERRNINKSLLTLGRVISILKEQSENKSKTVMIPYRDSKLTRILQEALGGRCKTVIIATISPSIINVQESLQTLHYAQTAIGIQNKPISNSYMSVSGSLSSYVLPSDGSMTVAAERWQEMEIRMEHMQQEVEEARQALVRNYMQQQEQKGQAEKAQQLLQKELDDARRELAIRTEDLRLLENTAKALEGKLRDTEETLRKTSVVLRATQQSEQALTSEASALLQALKDSIDDGDKLHKMVQASRGDEINRRFLTREFNRSIADIVKVARSKLEDIAASNKEHQRIVGEVVSSDHAQRLVAIEEARVVVSEMTEMMARACDHVSFGTSHETVPLLESLKDNIKLNIDEMRSMILSGDKDLSRSCAAAEQQLTNFSKALLEMNAKHDSKVKDSLFDVERAISNSKTKAEMMVKDAEEAIEAAQARSLGARLMLKNMFNNWKETGNEAAHRINDLSYTQHLVLENTHELLKSEMERHEAVNEALKAQLESLNCRDASQREALELQTRQLMLQQKQIDEAKQRQELLCGSVVDTVVNEVKNLVTMQIKLIMADQSQRMEELKSTIASIKELNGVLCNASVQMFDELRSTNASLAAEGRKLQSTDASLLTVLDDGKTAMTSIQREAEGQQNSLSLYEIETEEQLRELEAVNNEIEKARQGMLTAGKACAKHMEKSIDIATESISEIAVIGSEAISFSQNVVIREAAMSLAHIEEPRPNLLLNVSNHLDSMENSVVGGAKQLSVLAQMHSDEIVETTASISNTAANFKESTCAQHRSQCNLSRDKLAAVVQSHVDATEVLVSDCGGIIGSAAEKTQAFGGSVIAMDDQVDTAPPRKTIEFTEKLTATPREEVLLEGFRREQDDPTSIVSSSEDTSGDVNISETSGVLREIFSSNHTSEGAASPGKRRRIESSQSARRAKQKVK